MRLIADIGGTNSRLALSDGGRIVTSATRNYTNACWDSLYAVVADFLHVAGTPTLAEVVVAVAGPVNNNSAVLTNHKWAVEADTLSDLSGAPKVYLLNDLTALGYAVPKLRPEQLRLVRAGTAKQGAVLQSLVVGMGTGFNVSPVLQNQHTVMCPAVEAGHMSMPQSVSRKLDEIRFDPCAFATIEMLFSGRGFATFCQQLSGMHTLRGPDAIALYADPDHPKIRHAIDQYAALLGHLLHDLSLAYMPSAGIYLAGSVARSVMTMAPEACFETFGKATDVLVRQDAPVWTIADDLAALTGCAEFVL